MRIILHTGRAASTYVKGEQHTSLAVALASRHKKATMIRKSIIGLLAPMGGKVGGAMIKFHAALMDYATNPEQHAYHEFRRSQ